MKAYNIHIVIPALLLREVDSVLLCSEPETSALHVVGAVCAYHEEMAPTRTLVLAHELAHPMRGFSQRPPPGRISQSIRQRWDFAFPLWVVLRVGWKILTAR